MAKERALSIIKPDGIQKNLIGEVLGRFEKGGLRILAIKMLRLTKNQAEEFYAVHRGKPFFEPLIQYMISGPAVVSVLEGDNAIQKNRDIMGATDPKKAAPGTIRRDFAESIDANVSTARTALKPPGRKSNFSFPNCKKRRIS